MNLDIQRLVELGGEAIDAYLSDEFKSELGRAERDRRFARVNEKLEPLSKASLLQVIVWALEREIAFWQADLNDDEGEVDVFKRYHEVVFSLHLLLDDVAPKFEEELKRFYDRQFTFPPRVEEEIVVLLSSVEAIPRFMAVVALAEVLSVAARCYIPKLASVRGRFNRKEHLEGLCTKGLQKR